MTDSSAVRRLRTDGRDVAVLLVALVTVRLLFLALMPAVHSRDLDSWIRVARLLDAGINPYRETEVLNWPPFWMQCIFAAARIAARTGWSVLHVLQGFLMVGEGLCVVTAYVVLRRCYGIAHPFRILLFGLVLNPVSVFLSCQHGNFDVFVGWWVLLTVGALVAHRQRGEPQYWLAAAFFLGMGVLTKTVPLILTPLLLLCARGQRPVTIALGLLLLLAPVAIGMSVIYTLAPAGVQANVLGYRSMGGWYGISGVLYMLGLRPWNLALQGVMPFLFGAAMVVFFFRFRKPCPGPVQILRLALLTLVAVPTFGPGYSPPYVLWFLPLAVTYYAVAASGERRLWLGLYAVAVLTYCVEYALFESHGAFLRQLDPSPRVAAWSGEWGSRGGQTLLRLPLFGMYVAVFVQLLRAALRERRRAAATA